MTLMLFRMAPTIQLQEISSFTVPQSQSPMPYVFHPHPVLGCHRDLQVPVHSPATYHSNTCTAGWRVRTGDGGGQSETRKLAGCGSRDGGSSHHSPKGGGRKPKRCEGKRPRVFKHLVVSTLPSSVSSVYGLRLAAGLPSPPGRFHRINATE